MTLLYRIFFLVLFCVPGLAVPAQVIIIRHAEKVSDEETTLSGKGKQRADKLYQFFEQNIEASKFGKAVVIYSAKQKNSNSSMRSIETMVPYSTRAKIAINANYEKNKFKKVVKEIMQNAAYQGKTVIICFPHSHIDKLVKEFGLDEDLHWPDEVFDRAWILRFNKKTASELIDIGQRLLPGDSN